MKDHNTVSAEWCSYRLHVLPADAPPIQIRECRMAFYAGALAMFQLTRNLPDDDATAVVLLESYHAELLAFAKAQVAESEANEAKTSPQQPSVSA